VGLKDALRRLRRDASKDLDSFKLRDGSTFYYDRLATHKELYLYAYDVQFGDADKWPEPPEVFRKMCEAKDPAAILERFKRSYDDPEHAFVNVAELYDTDVLVRERRLVPLLALEQVEPVEDLSG
jgi:hypothetical protein